MQELTEQQATILEWAQRGYPAAAIAKVIGRTSSQVADQVGLIRKKGHEVTLVSAVEARRLDRAEAKRIADEYANWPNLTIRPDGLLQTRYGPIEPDEHGN